MLPSILLKKYCSWGGKVVSLSDSAGSIYDPEGVTLEKLEFVKDLKNNRRGRIKEYADKFGCEYLEGQRPWGIKCDVAFPSATQNELLLEDAQQLVSNGCLAVGEGANMPSTSDAVKYFIANGVLFGPAKAANAGVAVSGLEMTQNSMRISWDRSDLEDRLRGIMQSIHKQCLEYSTEGNGVPNYVDGANIAGFVKVAEAMLNYGISKFLIGGVRFYGHYRQDNSLQICLTT